MQYVSVQILCGKSTLHAADMQGNLTLRNAYVQRSHCSVAMVRT